MTYEDWVAENLDLYLKLIEQTRISRLPIKKPKRTILQKLGLMP